MSIYTHIQRTGTRRSAIVATIVVAVLGLAPAGLAAGSKDGGKTPTARFHPMPGGGCSSVCKRY
jgi:hypothetical protein